MKYKKWNIAAPDERAVNSLTSQGIPALAATLLCARGYDSSDKAFKFLNEGDTPLSDPFSIKDMDRAVERISLALQNDEYIAIYGDYDVDGITSVCLLSRFLQGKGGRVRPYIPDRLEEGYGLNRSAVELLANEGVTLIITVDCGITAIDEAAYAQSLGVDVVITDHHECPGELPVASAVVDPHREDCPSEFKCYAGVGVALMLALAMTGEGERDEVFSKYSDLAAVGTVADVMKLRGDNRTIVSRGLDSLRAGGRPGFRALARESLATGREFSSTCISFSLAPKINAAGRMGMASVASDLIFTDDPDTAEELAAVLTKLNLERREIEGEIFDECISRIERDPGANRRAIVIAGKDWHQGVAGIVASRLSERYSCPSIVICLQDGRGKGSCRSFGGFNLFSVLEGCSDLLENFGGHEQAAGLTVLEENIDELTARINTLIEQQTGGAEFVSSVNIDADIQSASLLTTKEVVGLDILEPFGVGNTKPVFSLSGCHVLTASEVGGGKHLKLKLGFDGQTFDAIYFSSTIVSSGVSQGDRVDIIFTPQINRYRSSTSVQLQVCDMRPAQTRVEAEQMLYERFVGGEQITSREAALLTPSREDFAAVWRYIRDKGGEVEATSRHIAKAVATSYGTRESLMRTLICLDVLHERGIIEAERIADRMRVTLNPDSPKVNLNESHIMEKLAQAAELSQAASQ